MKKKYKGGGGELGGNPPKTGAPIVIKSSEVNPYITPQEGGTTGYVDIRDQYTMAKKYLDIPYDEATWQKLGADEKQRLNHMVYEKLGFTKTSTGSYSTNGLPNKFNLGGEIGNILGQASAFIPGIGPVISPILSPLLESAGNSLGENDEKILKTTKSNVASTNVSGNYKDGGKAPDNLKPLEGGYFSKLSDGIFIAKGNTHKQGGIEGDVDGDNKAEIEFEKGELYFDEEEYIISAENSNKFKSSFSKRDDKVAKTTNALLKDLAIKTNETTLKAKDGGHFSMYAGGGKLSNFVEKIFSFFKKDDDTEIDFQGSMQDGVPRQYNFWEPQPVTPYGINDAMFNLTALDGSLQEPSIKSTPTGANPLYGQGAAKGVASLNYKVPEAKGSVYTPPADSERMGLTSGDKLIMAGQLVPAAYNLARGLFDKAEVVSPEVHPYADKIKSIMGNRTYNPQTVQNEINYATAAGKESITENTTSASVTRSNFQNLYDVMARNKAKADLEGQQMNNQYKSEYAQTLDSLGRFELAANAAADQATWENQVAKDDYISTGVTQVGSAVNTIGAGVNQNATNNMLFNILGEVAQNYTIDKNGKIIFKG